MIALVIISLLWAIISSIICVWLVYANKKQNQQIQLYSLNNKTINRQNTEIAELNDQIDGLNNLIDTLNNQINQMRANSLTIAQDNEKENRELIKKQREILSNYQDRIQKLSNELRQFEQSKSFSNKMYKQIQSSWNEMAAALDQIRAEMDQSKKELTDLKNQKAAALERLNNVDEGRTMEWNATDKLLTDTLEQLKISYPSLADAFAAIEWSRIWQSKFQAMTADIKPAYDKCGIYRIWTVENGVVKSYVGQARKIRERWSQHIKKMLGVMVADNHKFYSFVKPYNAHFEIIEEVEESKLNEREHYWIEYYDCVCSGYNIRK